MIYFENLDAIGVIAMTKKSTQAVVIKKKKKKKRLGCECELNLR